MRRENGRVSGGDLVVSALRAHGCEVCFGLIGTHALPLFDALYRDGSIRYIGSRTELSAAFLADGYARASGKPGVCIVTTGPGALATLPALGEADADSSPVLLISTQLESPLIDERKGGVHEMFPPDRLLRARHSHRRTSEHRVRDH